MTLISKICVVFLLWTVVGVALNYSVLLYYQLKAMKLIGKDQKTFDEYVDDSLTEAITSIGANYESLKRDGHEEETEKRTKLEDLVLLSVVGILWPWSVALLKTAYGETYYRYKAEYQSGARIRKEPS